MDISPSLHFETDPILCLINQQIDLVALVPIPDALYSNLLTSVLSQQLSTKAAETIHGRFIKLFPNDYPDPGLLRNKTDEELRTAGVSRQKAGYLRNIATKFDEDDLVHADWAGWSDDEILAHLTQIKGVGTWTAQIILMFTLGREDIFPTGDIGIQSAMDLFWELPEKGKPRIKKMIEIAETWRPYRTYACQLLWKAKDQNIQI